MAARSRCPPSGGQRPNISRPGLTRTQMLRAAKTSAIVQKEPQPEQSRRGPCPARSRTGLAKLGPPPADPKKIDFAQPTMTKAMQMRQKVAAEKLKALDAQQKADTSRRPRRTPAPVGGDARLGRQRCASSARKTPEQQLKVLQDAINRGHVVSKRGGDRGEGEVAALDGAIARGHVVTERGGARPKRRPPAGPSRGPRPLATATPISQDTRELAKLMSAEIVQAVPISEGPVNKILIDPGAIRGDRSTIVYITAPDQGSADGAVGEATDIAKKSIRAISETLDDQDAAESAAVQGKLEELQNARREFVIAVANVGGNAVNIQDESADSILNIDEMNDQLDYMPSPPRQRAIVNLPDITHPMLSIRYGRNHPQVEAARRFSKKIQMEQDEMQAQKRIEDIFEREICQQAQQDFDLDVPLEQDLQDADISWEEDEDGNLSPCESRIKASMRAPRRGETCPAQRFANMEEIERFVDLKNYPPSQRCPEAPPGRENLNPDLWDIDDPWYFEDKTPESSPLIRFDSNC